MQCKKNLLPWIVCFSTSLFFAYELLQLHILNAISSLLMRDLQLSATQFGTLSATYLIADVIFLLPAGILLDKFSVRRIILAALLLCILGTLGFCRSHSLHSACVCHFLSGIGNAFCFLSCMILVSRWFPRDKQAFVMGLMITVGMLGGVIAQLPFSLLAHHFSWRTALLIDALIGMMIFLLIFIFVQDGAEKLHKLKNKTEKKIPFWLGIKHSVFNMHNICCGLYTGFMNLPLMVIGAVWGSLFLSQIHHIPPIKASFIVSMLCVGTIVGSPIFGWLSDKIKRRLPIMAWGGISSIVVMLLLLMSIPLNEAVLIILFFLLGFMTSSQILGYPAITEHNPPNLIGTSMGIAALIIMGMPALIHPLSGTLLDWKWNGAICAGVPLYTSSDFIRAFSLFPIGFIFALIALCKIKESPNFSAHLHAVET